MDLVRWTNGNYYYGDVKLRFVPNLDKSLVLAERNLH